ncbi:MAG: PEP-CTERM sorting domain-containing protein, partial [Planctomycetaceae bacterium]|nr:PEP-CTERM sorting domain-containing protein [Planctomycetaceae bacterium]
VLDFSSASAQSVPLAAAFTAPALFDAGVLSAAAGSPSFADDFSFDIAGIFNFIGEDAGFVNAAEWWETIDSVQLLTSGGSEYLLTSFGGGVFGSGEAESSTPEPATLLILGLGLAGLGLARRRRK